MFIIPGMPSFIAFLLSLFSIAAAVVVVVVYCRLWLPVCSVSYGLVVAVTANEAKN